jgi:hypothetical protein
MTQDVDSEYKIFHDILYVLHTGIQWDQLKTKRNAHSTELRGDTLSLLPYA